MIKVLIVDDSSFMRVRIRTLLETCDQIKVVGIARNGMDALQKTLILRPDVITMDINMPDISGIKAVEMIMKQCPTPIIMVSSLTYDGANETLEALEKGAIDYIHKDQLNEKNLIEKIFLAKDAKLNINPEPAHKPSVSITQDTKNLLFGENYKKLVNTDNINSQRAFSIVAIGISTGGPSALAKLLPRISPDIPASIVIAQHMPPSFTKPLAERLNKICRVPVKEAEHGEKLLPGHAYICPGGNHIMIEQKNVVSLYDRKTYPDYHYCPSATLLMSSVAKTYADNALCIIMTGMGSDGLEGIMEAREKGSYIIAQSENSSVIFGMPKAIITNNLQDEIAHLDHIADRINELCIKE